LSDWLTTARGYPNMVVNEGVGGNKSSDGLARLPGVLALNPQAQYFLILFGTNDSFISLGNPPVPSGLDANGVALPSSDPNYPGSYLDNMNKIIDAVILDNRTPILALVPITLGPCSTCAKFTNPDTEQRNLLIKDYNKVVLYLAGKKGIAVTPPDFYNYFRSHQDQFSDNLHPNGAGYQAMADLWLQALILTPP
jgi:lysophospholipase L1-like esterase